jgi:hypothetical protein
VTESLLEVLSAALDTSNNHLAIETLSSFDGRNRKYLISQGQDST